MRRLIRTMVVAPLYLFVYGAVLVWSFTNPFWGFMALGVLDLLGIGVVAIVVYRITSVHGWVTRHEARPVAGWVTLGLFVQAILHIAAAYLPSGETQSMVGYFAPILPIAFGIIYLLMKGRPDPQS